jgi:rubrerythrin
MADWKSVDEVLDFAIKNEEEAAEFYTDLAKRMDRPWMSKIFAEFAREEMGHKRKLLDVKAGKRLISAQGKVLDLKISDYLVDAQVTDGMDYQDALVVAMKKEKKAFMMYTDLAESTDDEGLKETFLALAQEEAKHKLRFEVEYDDYIMSEN